jgi:hypothetical protein
MSCDSVCTVQRVDHHNYLSLVEFSPAGSRGQKHSPGLPPGSKIFQFQFSRPRYNSPGAFTALPELPGNCPRRILCTAIIILRDLRKFKVQLSTSKVTEMIVRRESLPTIPNNHILLLRKTWPVSAHLAMPRRQTTACTHCVSIDEYVTKGVISTPSRSIPHLFSLCGTDLQWICRVL